MDMSKKEIETREKQLHDTIQVEYNKYGYDILFSSDKYLENPTEFHDYFLKRTKIIKDIIKKCNDELIILTKLKKNLERR